MRNKLAAFLVLGAIVSFVPAEIAHAATRPPLSSSKCPAGSSSEVSSKQSILLTAKTKEEDAQRFLNTAIYCPNACYDLQASFVLTNDGVQIDISAAHKCSSQDKAPDDPAQSPQRGCLKGLQEPQITLSLKDVYSKWYEFAIEDQTLKKSRCDEDTLASSVKKFLGGLTTATEKDGNKIGQDQMEAALRDLRTNSDPRPTTPLADSSVISSAFDEEAETLKATNPEAYDSIKSAVKEGNPEKAAEEAKKVGLDPDIAANAARLQAEKNKSPELTLGAAPVGEAGVTGEPTGFTGSVGFEDARNAIASIESNGNYYAVGPQTRTGNRAYGRYQVMDFNIPSWTRGACGSALTPNQFLADTGCQEQVFNVYYGKAVARCGDYYSAAAAWHSGKCVAGSSSDGYITTSAYVSRFEAALGKAVPFGANAHVYTAGTSPFANIWSSGVSSGGTAYGAGGSPLTNLISLFRNRSSDSGSGSQSQGGQRPSSQTPSGGSSGGTQQTVEANAAVIVQPTKVDRGDPFVVSWSSVGINPLDPCRLYMNVGGTNELLMHLNEGSRTIVPSATSTPGVWEFTLQCPKPSGGVLERTASTSVQ